MPKPKALRVRDVLHARVKPTNQARRFPIKSECGSLVKPNYIVTDVHTLLMRVPPGVGYLLPKQHTEQAERKKPEEDGSWMFDTRPGMLFDSTKYIVPTPGSRVLRAGPARTFHVPNLIEP